MQNMANNKNPYFNRPITNADKAALIVLLLDGFLPEYGENELEDLCWAFMALTGQDEETAKRAFADAHRFNWLRIEDNEETN